MYEVVSGCAVLVECIARNILRLGLGSSLARVVLYGAHSQHAIVCGMGFGMFLNLASSSIMLVAGDTGMTRDARWGSLHLDEYGTPKFANGF